jgi:hypothetical protein
MMGTQEREMHALAVDEHFCSAFARGLRIVGRDEHS